MKFGRQKAEKRFFGIYKNHFGCTEVYLSTGAFENKVQIFDQIKNYFRANVVFLTKEW